MAIDDPVGIEIQQATEDSEARSHLPAVAARLALSGAAAIALAGYPFFSQIVANLLVTSPARFEKRFLRIAAALEEQQRNIASKIPDMRYYESEEFQTLFLLVLEKLHSTHQDEKLKTFGQALANSGTSDFVADPKEQYIRILQDLGLEDIHALRQIEKLNQLPPQFRTAGIPKQENASQSRLASLGLIHESLSLKDFNLHMPALPNSQQSAENYARSIAQALKQYFREAPTATYQLSKFGEKFLAFIVSASPEGKTEPSK